MTDVIYPQPNDHKMLQKFSDFSYSHHLQENPTSNGGLLIPEAVVINSLSVVQASLNQLRGPEGASDVNSRAVFVCANISSISGCQFQIFNGPVNVVHERRRFHVIESDEED